ncbi:hypothetical protein [Chamaesiphon sp.]|uniref:hypothetical protein n=1 Tax=Chamaesiphon sp. TaxID=2814140 RepID=UPI0035944548
MTLEDVSTLQVRPNAKIIKWIHVQTFPLRVVTSLRRSCVLSGKKIDLRVWGGEHFRGENKLSVDDVV